MSYATIRHALYLLGLSVATSSCATGQRMVDTAGRAAEAEAATRVVRGVSSAADATEDAVTGGEDAGGGGSAAGSASAGSAPAAAGSSSTGPLTVSSSSDFEPGNVDFLVEDYASDHMGDFPRHFVLTQGSFDIVEWQGARYLRALSGGIFAIPLPGTLPERFTLETSVSVQHGNAYLRIMPKRALWGPDRNYRGSMVTVELSQAGIRAHNEGPSATTHHDASVVTDGVAPLQVMADGAHMKVYLDGKRVANVPNAIFPRSDTLFVAVSSASEEYPVLLGSIRIASGGADLYGALEREGRVALQGVYFDTGSDRLRPESHATLSQVGQMLSEHPDLRLSVEGHTDSQGDDNYNLDLSEKRAAAVRSYLVQEFGIESGRLSSRGLGETQPVASNDTAEGRQLNRRVELVRIP